MEGRSQEQLNGVELLRILTTYFNDEELRTLCFNLNIDYDTLRGEEKAAKARELVALAKRHDRSAELVGLCRELRPKVDWSKVVQTAPPEPLLIPGPQPSDTPSWKPKGAIIVAIVVIVTILGITLRLTQIIVSESAIPVSSDKTSAPFTSTGTQVSSVIESTATVVTIEVPQDILSTPTSIAVGATIVLSPIPSSCSPQPVNPNNDAPYYYQLGQDYYQKGLGYQRQDDKEHAKLAFKCAVYYFTYAIALKDKYIEATQHRALAYYQIGDYDSAIEGYTQAINLAPNDKQKAVYHYHRGDNYYLRGRDLCKSNRECTLSAFNAAIEDYTTTILAIPNCVSAHTQRAFVYRQRNEEGDADRAIADDEQASKLKEVSVPCSD